MRRRGRERGRRRFPRAVHPKLERELNPWHLMKMQIWFSRAGTGPESLHFWQDAGALGAGCGSSPVLRSGRVPVLAHERCLQVWLLDQVQGTSSQASCSHFVSCLSRIPCTQYVGSIQERFVEWMKERISHKVQQQSLVQVSFPAMTFLAESLTLWNCYSICWRGAVETTTSDISQCPVSLLSALRKIFLFFCLIMFLFWLCLIGSLQSDLTSNSVGIHGSHFTHWSWLLFIFYFSWCLFLIYICAFSSVL